MIICIIPTKMQMDVFGGHGRRRRAVRERGRRHEMWCRVQWLLCALHPHREEDGSPPALLFFAPIKCPERQQSGEQQQCCSTHNDKQAPSAPPRHRPKYKHSILIILLSQRQKNSPRNASCFQIESSLAQHHPCTWNLEIAYADGHPVGTGSRRNLRPIQASNLLHLPPLECVCVCALDFLSPPPSPLSHGPSFLFESASSEAKLTTCCSPENQEIEPYASNFREIQAGMPSQAQIDVSTRSPTAHRPFLPPGRHLVLASTLGRKPPHLALLRMVLPKGLLGHSLLQLLSAILVDLPLSRDLFLSLSTVCLSPT